MIKKIVTLLLTALSLGLVTGCGSFGGGDIDLSSNPVYKKLKGANAKFWDARIEAAKCIGDNDKANQLKAIKEQYANAKTGDDIKAVNDSAKDLVVDFTNQGKLTSASAKQHFQASLVNWIAGVGAETLILNVVQDQIKEVNEKVQKASPLEKTKILDDLKPLTVIADVLQQDIKNATSTIDAYTVYATKNGIDMNAVKAQAAKVQKSLED